MLQDKITQYTEEIKQFAPTSSADVENFRLKFLVSKGIVKSLFDEFKTVSVEEKRVLGMVLNEFKQFAEKTYQEAHEKFGANKSQAQKSEGDLTLPGQGLSWGPVIHCLWYVKRLLRFLRNWVLSFLRDLKLKMTGITFRL
ncbi:hypothetical protein L950_0218865 [Sphingobacterium sp. IITKGP-BTPF85]|nr:hypothetical protein L950_0218865 [Sphingobacterium sp. IITKGP-BTPF85]